KSLSDNRLWPCGPRRPGHRAWPPTPCVSRGPQDGRSEATGGDSRQRDGGPRGRLAPARRGGRLGGLRQEPVPGRAHRLAPGGGVRVRRGAARVVHQGRDGAATLRRGGWGAVRGGGRADQQLLAGALDPASRDHQPARPPRRPRGGRGEGLRRAEAPGAGGDPHLRGLARGQLRADLRTDLPDAVHAEVPHHRGGEPEHRLGGAAALPGAARGGAARRRLPGHAEHPLRPGLSLPGGGRLPGLPRRPDRGVHPRAGASCGRGGSAAARGAVRQRGGGRVRPPDLLGPAARPGADDRGRARGRPRGRQPPRLHHARAGEPRGGAPRCLRGELELLLRRRVPVQPGQLPAHLLHPDGAGRDERDPGRGVLLPEVPPAGGSPRGVDRADDRGPDPVRGAPPRRPHRAPPGDARAVCEHHLRPRAGGRAPHGPRLPGRGRHRLLRPLRRLGLPLVGRGVPQRGARSPGRARPRRGGEPRGVSTGPGTPRVSIAVPVYNGERYLRASLDGLLAQTFTDFELVIADNASTDGTEAICREYVARDARVRYHRNERNLGGPGNFRRVFQLSRGEYHKWSTADDLWHPTLVEKCVAVLDARPDVVLAYPRSNIVDAEGRVVRTFDDPLDLPEESPAVRVERVILES